MKPTLFGPIVMGFALLLSSCVTTNPSREISGETVNGADRVLWGVTDLVEPGDVLRINTPDKNINCSGLFSDALRAPFKPFLTQGTIDSESANLNLANTAHLNLVLLGSKVLGSKVTAGLDYGSTVFFDAKDTVINQIATEQDTDAVLQSVDMDPHKTARQRDLLALINHDTSATDEPSHAHAHYWLVTKTYLSSSVTYNITTKKDFNGGFDCKIGSQSCGTLNGTHTNEKTNDQEMSKRVFFVVVRPLYVTPYPKANVRAAADTPPHFSVIGCSTN